MSILRLIRIDFDNLENRNPEWQTTVGVFTNNERIDEYFNRAPPVKLYCGYNHQVYPRFEFIEEVEL